MKITKLSVEDLIKENQFLRERLNNSDRVTKLWDYASARALGLARGCIRIREAEEFNKNGLINNLEEIEKVLSKFEESDDK